MGSSLLNGCKLGWLEATSSIFLEPGSPVNATGEDVAWFASIPLPASIINVFICLWFVNNASRRFMVILPLAMQGLMWLILCFTRSVRVIMFCVFVKGLTDNFLVGIIPVYIGEIASPKNRELLGFTYGLMFTVGKCLEYAIGINSYPVLCALPFFISLLACVLSYWMIESPYYLVAIDKPEAAKVSFSWLTNQHNDEIVEKELDDIKQFVEQNKESMDVGVLQVLLRPDNLKLYGFFTVVYSLAHFTCEAIMTNYGFQIIKNLDSLLNGPDFVTVCNVVFIGGFFVSLVNLKKFDRRMLLLVGFLVLAGVQLLCALFFYIAEKNNYDAPISSNIVVLLLILVLFVYMITLTPALLILRSEIFPYKIKEFCGLSMNFLIDCMTFVELQAFFPVSDVAGESFVVLLFAVGCTIGAYMANRMRDTKNKSLLQIQMEQNSSGIS